MIERCNSFLLIIAKKFLLAVTTTTEHVNKIKVREQIILCIPYTLTSFWREIQKQKSEVTKNWFHSITD